ncbi:MAG: DUF721 domain-containing protein [Alphaproteobacteria bacterium]|nr:DUF721 domain-containing protein [Alphaproteobacteria bacterium]
MSDSSQAPETRRVRRGPHALAQDAIGLLRQHLKARGFAQIELVTRWPEIAGQSLSEHCFPYRLSAGGASGATLTLVANDRAALELQHQAPKIIDRINRFFGSSVVSKIKVVAGDIPKPSRQRPARRALNAAEEADLAARIAAVEDPDLRAALTRLGRHALAESRKSAIYSR